MLFAVPVDLTISLSGNTPSVALEIQQAHASSFAEDIASGVANATYGLAQITSQLVQYLGEFLDDIINFTLKYNYDNIAGIDAGWKTVRDVANLFFIFILLFIAIKMIIGRESGGKDIKNVIIVALLINFSLFFTKVVIDASNIFSLYLYNASVSTEITTNPDLTEDQIIQKDEKLQELLAESKLLNKQYNFIKDKIMYVGRGDDRARSNLLFAAIQNQSFRKEVEDTLINPLKDKYAYYTKNTPAGEWDVLKNNGNPLWPFFARSENGDDIVTLKTSRGINGISFLHLWNTMTFQQNDVNKFFKTEWGKTTYLIDANHTYQLREEQFFGNSISTGPFNHYVLKYGKDALVDIEEQIKKTNAEITLLNTELRGEDLETATISTSFMKVLGIQALFLNSAALNDTGNNKGAIAFNLFLIVFLAFTFWAFLKMSMILVARVIILMFLLVFSPLALLGFLIPRMRKSITDKWVETLLGQALVGPVFFFFIFLILKITESLTEAVSTGSFESSSSLVATPNQIGGSQIFTFILIIGLIYIAMKTTKKVAGEFTAEILGAGAKIAAGAGGLALGVATGGTAMALKGTVGRIASSKLAGRIGSQKWLSKEKSAIGADGKATKVRVPNFAGRSYETTRRKAAQGSFDARNTKAGGFAYDTVLKKGLGAILNSNLKNTEIVDRKKTEGGWEKKQERDQEKILKESEKRKVSQNSPLYTTLMEQQKKQSAEAPKLMAEKTTAEQAIKEGEARVQDIDTTIASNEKAAKNMETNYGDSNGAHQIRQKNVVLQKEKETRTVEIETTKENLEKTNGSVTKNNADISRTKSSIEALTQQLRANYANQTEGGLSYAKNIALGRSVDTLPQTAHKIREGIGPKKAGIDEVLRGLIKENTAETRRQGVYEMRRDRKEMRSNNSDTEK